MYRVGLITGSSPGAREALEGALEALDRLGVQTEHHEVDLGAQRYLRTGELLPDHELERLRDLDALLCGSPPASNDPAIPPGLLERGVVFGLRQALGLAVNLRVFRGVGVHQPADVAVVRENSEGAYAAEGVVLHAGTEFETATEVSTATYAVTQRCVRFAFEIAGSRRGRLTLAHKSRVLLATGALWERVVSSVAQEFPEVRCNSENVDTLCARLIDSPENYDVIVTDNVFGDIVSDVAGAATRSASYSASAELTYFPTGPSLFEPMHGAQDIHGGAEPVSLLGALSAAATMARQLGEEKVAGALENATLAAAEAGRTSAGRAEILDEVCVRAHDMLGSVR